MSKLNIKGQKFGKLLAIKPLKSGKHGIIWEFKCDCGKTHFTEATRAKDGSIRSCGCGKVYGHVTHGYTRMGHKIPEYSIWSQMKYRCQKKTGKTYKIYGARGIKVCKRWRNSFTDFLQDMGRRPPGTSIGRIDNDGNYEPSNCEWQSNSEQMNNTRQNRFVVIDGKKDTLTRWCKLFNVPFDRVKNRINDGWEPKSALLIPKINERKIDSLGRFVKLWKSADCSGSGSETLVQLKQEQI